MLALGSCIAGAGILATGLLALLFRNPYAPRWTRSEIVAMLMCVPVAVITGVGLGYTAFGLFQLVKGAGDPRDPAVLAAVVAVPALLWRALRIRQRLKDFALASGGSSPSLYLAAEPALSSDDAAPRRPGPERLTPAVGPREAIT